mmetsp:Transcript_16431/g.23179  ORF Transcript_16431/g.23179 Transcript_16431/m.23179 type:complete len:85 (-) Transcript_16431:27-281(-)
MYALLSLSLSLFSFYIYLFCVLSFDILSYSIRLFCSSTPSVCKLVLLSNTSLTFDQFQRSRTIMPSNTSPDPSDLGTSSSLSAT